MIESIRPIVWIDQVDLDYNPDDDWLYDFRLTLAVSYEMKAEDCEEESDTCGKAMALTLRAEAARIRGFGMPDGGRVEATISIGSP